MPDRPCPDRTADLRRIEQALHRIARISLGRTAAQVRAERSGVFLSRPQVSILSALHHHGPQRITELSRIAGVEATLISREVQALEGTGHVERASDPDDGRVSIVHLTGRGAETFAAYRAATDAIIAETFAGWTTDELADLAGTVERVAADFARPRPGPVQAVAGA